MNRVVVAERGVKGGGEGELEDAVVLAVPLDEERPFFELGEAGLEVWLEGEEGGEGIVAGEGEGVGRGSRSFGGHAVWELFERRWDWWTWDACFEVEDMQPYDIDMGLMSSLRQFSAPTL